MIDNNRKIERGVMIMKEGKAWGVNINEGVIKSYGWVDIKDASIHDPEYCTHTSHVTYPSSPYIKELKTGKIVEVERVTVTTIVGDA